MKFDPLTKKVFTDKGEFVKAMNCPFKMRWDQLGAFNSTSRKCSNCDHSVVNTDGLEDDELLHIIRGNPETCLKINLNQHNITIITNGILGKK